MALRHVNVGKMKRDTPSSESSGPTLTSQAQPQMDSRSPQAISDLVPFDPRSYQTGVFPSHNRHLTPSLNEDARTGLMQ